MINLLQCQLSIINICAVITLLILTKMAKIRR